MKAKLVDFYSVDIEQSLFEFIPEDVKCFGFWSRIIVGELNLGGEESFDIFICTPQWLILNHNKTDIIFGKNYLIVFEYNYDRIFDKLKKYVESITGDNWDEIGNKINRIGKWEFEDYSNFR